jgi:hypothetical protein
MNEGNQVVCQSKFDQLQVTLVLMLGFVCEHFEAQAYLNQSGSETYVPFILSPLR